VLAAEHDDSELVCDTLRYVDPLPFGRICFVVLVMRKGGRAVEVVHGIYAVHWKFSVCTAAGLVHTARLGRVFLCAYLA